MYVQWFSKNVNVLYSVQYTSIVKYTSDSVASVTNLVGHVNPTRKKKKLQYEMYAFFPTFFLSLGEGSVVHGNFTGFFVHFVVSSFSISIRKVDFPEISWQH